MTGQWIGTLGLLLNIVGVALAFFFGYPQPSHEEGAGIGLESGTRLSDGRTVAEHDASVRAQKARYLFWSRSGLALMFLGFALQLWALWAVAPSA